MKNYIKIFYFSLFINLIYFLSLNAAFECKDTGDTLRVKATEGKYVLFFNDYTLGYVQIEDLRRTLRALKIDRDQPADPSNLQDIIKEIFINDFKNSHKSHINVTTIFFQSIPIATLFNLGSSITNPFVFYPLNLAYIAFSTHRYSKIHKFLKSKDLLFDTVLMTSITPLSGIIYEEIFAFQKRFKLLKSKKVIKISGELFEKYRTELSENIQRSYINHSLND